MDEKQREERDKLIDEIKKKSEEANEAMREGKGRLKLETPILSRDQKIEEVIYDFTKLTGMDSHPQWILTRARSLLSVSPTSRDWLFLQKQLKKKQKALT